MNRTKPLKRGAPLRRHHRVGRAARKRVRHGGVLSKARPSLSAAGYATLRNLLMVRARGRSEFSGELAPLDVEHCVPRSAGGADSWQNCWLSTRGENARKHFAFTDGRLLTFALGDGRFVGRIVVAEDKDAFRRGEYTITREVVFGRPPTDAERAILDALR